MSFTKFISQQKQWVRELLLYTNMEKGVTLAQILLEHDEAEGLLIVSDGSVDIIICCLDGFFSILKLGRF